MTQFGKSIPFGKSQEFPELYVKRNRILWILAERYNILPANAVEKWGYDERWIQFVESGSFAKLCMGKFLWYNKWALLL